MHPRAVWLWSACTLLPACALERLYDEFYMTEPPTEASTDSTEDGGQSSDTTAASTSTSGDGDGTAGSTGAQTADTTANASTSGASTADGSTSDASSTAGPTPFCGDGEVNTPDEECDDGNADIDDACVLCQRARLIYLTSALVQGKNGGLVNMDATCKSLAYKAMNEVPGSPIADPTNFKALLSTSTQTVFDRHFAGKGPYRRVDGLTVSDSFAGLFGAPHKSPINVDERGQLVANSAVWTGTNIDGSPYPGINFCGDWTDNWGTANYGLSDHLDSEWIHAISDLNPDSDCASELPIYCVEQE